jgi:hypothetical protein
MAVQEIDFQNQALNELQDILNAAHSPTSAGNHKHNGQPGEGPKISPGDQDVTIDSALIGGSNTGTLLQVVCWMAKTLKAITQKINWWDTANIKVKAAELADAAKNDKRFVFCGQGHSQSNVSAFVISKIFIKLAAGETLKLKKARYWFNSSSFRLKVQDSSGASSWIASANYGEQDLDAIISTGNQVIDVIITGNGSEPMLNFDGWWLEFEIV